MGFYQPAQLVRDARDHGVAVRAVDHPEPVRRLYVAVREAVADRPATRHLLNTLAETASV